MANNEMRIQWEMKPNLIELNKFKTWILDNHTHISQVHLNHDRLGLI